MESIHTSEATVAAVVAATTAKTREVPSAGKCDFFVDKCDHGHMNDLK